MRFPRPGARRLPASATAVGGAAFALALAVSTPAGADQPPFRTPVGAIPLSAEEFRAFAEGWTLHFERDGAPFGTESFGHGGRTLWRPEGGSCTPGFWAAVGSEVCFFYGDASACWLLWRDAGGVIARSSPDGGMEVRVSRRDRAAVACGEELLSLAARPATAS